MSPDPDKKYLAGQSPYGLMIEVGPVANNLLAAEVLESSLNLLESILMALQKNHLYDDQNVEIYEEIQDIYYPQDEQGQITGYIHPNLQNKDFCLLQNEFLAFKKFTGEEVFIKISEDFYPIFINEAAYYPQKLAFTLCRKRSLKH